MVKTKTKSFELVNGELKLFISYFDIIKHTVSTTLMLVYLYIKTYENMFVCTSLCQFVRSRMLIFPKRENKRNVT